jgi:hypothetical protein
VWGSPESLEGMNAFLEGRKPDFQKFRMRGKQQLEDYLEGCANDQNAPPSMRPLPTVPRKRGREGRGAGGKSGSKNGNKNGNKVGNKNGRPAP